MFEPNTIVCAAALDFIKSLPDASVDCCITSPPYYGLRDYGVEGQYGREPSIAEYVANMVALMSEVKRVLKTTGTAFFNVSDSYATGQKGGSGGVSKKQDSNREPRFESLHTCIDEPAAKSLMLIPERLLIAFQHDGWIIRNQIIWHKPNPMPESVRDRFTRSYEVVFFMVKSGRYYFDAEAVSEPVKDSSIARGRRAVSEQHKNLEVPGRTTHTLHKKRANGEGYPGIGHKRTGGNFSKKYAEAQPNHGAMQLERGEYQWANKRDVWTVIPSQFKGPHFATFPEALITPMILAGCPPRGVVLDPFMGSGTTALVARKYNRQFIGSELNSEYIEIATKRLALPYTTEMFNHGN